MVTHPVYTFGPFQFDPNEQVLRCGDQALPVTPKELETLLILLENHGQLVDKNVLMDRLWPNVFVEEGNLARHISYLRKKLGDTATGSRFVETVPKRGYRFVAPVTIRPAVETPGHRAHPSVAVISDSPPAVKAPAVVVSSARVSRNVWIGSLAILISIGVIFAVLVKDRQVPNASHAPFQPITINRVTDSGRVLDAAISADGIHVAYVEMVGDLYSLRLKRLSTNDDTELVPASKSRYIGITFAPTGDFLYFVRFKEGRMGVGIVYRVPLLGGPVTQVAADCDSPVSFSPDGSQFVFRRDVPDFEQRLVIANVDSGWERTLSTRREPAAYVGFPSWSQDGAEIISPAILDEPGSPTTLIFVNVKTGQEQLHGRFNLAIRQAVSTNGRGLLATTAAALSADSGQVGYIALPGNDLHSATSDLDDYGSHLSTTRDGKVAVVVRQWTQTQLWTFPTFDSAAARQVTNTQESLTDVRWDLRGRFLTKNIAGELAMRNLDGSGRTVLPTTRVINFDAGCDQGRHIVYSALVKDHRTARIFRIDPDGGGGPWQISSGMVDTQVTCSATSRDVFYLSRGKAAMELKRVLLDGKQETTIADGSFWGSNLFDQPLHQSPFRVGMDPTGTRLVLVTTEGSTSETFRTILQVFDVELKRFIFAVDVDFDKVRGARFTPDGKALVLNVVENGTSNLWLQPIGIGPRRQLTFFASDQILDMDFSPDGKQMVIVRGRQTRDAVRISYASER